MYVPELINGSWLNIYTLLCLYACVNCSWDYQLGTLADEMMGTAEYKDNLQIEDTGPGSNWIVLIPKGQVSDPMHIFLRERFHCMPPRLDAF